MNINELLNIAKRNEDLDTDYQLAKRLEIHNGWIGEYRTGVRHPSIEVAFKLAIMANIDPATVIAGIEFETTKNEKRREFFRDFLQQHGTAAVLMLALSSTLSSTDARADFRTGTADVTAHYAKRRQRKKSRYSRSDRRQISSCSAPLVPYKERRLH
jgi:transcriptional regulator with XRE-family HTH domain